MIVLSLVLVVLSAAALSWGIATTSDLFVWGSLLTGLAAVALVVGSVVRHRRRQTAGQADSALAPSPPALPSSASSTAPTSAAPVSPAQASPAPQEQPQRPRAAWPWSADAGTADPAVGRSGWTGAVGPAPGAPEAAAAPPAPAGPAAQPAEERPAQEPSRPLGAAGQNALGAATDRPLGEPFPELSADDGEPPIEDVPIRDALRVAQLDDDVQVVDGHPRYHLAGCPTVAGAGLFPLPVSAARRAGFTPCAVCAPDRTLLARSRDRRPPAVS